jgi:xylan 1,4-beta-xylosidase
MKRKSWLGVLLPLCLLFAAPAQRSPQIQSFTVDAARSTGKIKAMQDLDNGPLCQRGIVDLTKYYKELGVHWVRLHDVPWTYDNSFDINYVFPRWDADPEKPQNYDFTQTDYYLNTIISQGMAVIYRLGYSAEYKTAVHHNVPPSSYDKFAEISAHIIQHHDQGWANGRHDGIQYWEIWNEPDGHSFWAGTPEQFYQLYAVTAKALKKQYPSLKFGGPALAGNLTFLEGFLKYAHEHQVPVDFVSWHIYTQDADEVARRANKVHALMVQYGYPNAESILDEWNYGPSDWKRLFVDANASRTYFDATQNAFGAAFDAAVLIGLQDAPVDIATYYSGTTLMWGLFTSSGAPQKAYFAFLAFRRMLDSPNRLGANFAPDAAVKALAGISEDKQTVRILMTNPTKNAQSVQITLANLPWKGPSRYEQQVVNDRYDLQSVGGAHTSSSTVLKQEVAGQSVVLLTIRAAGM